MNAKKWIKFFLLFNLLLPMNMLINYIVDPLDIFHSGILKKYAQLNERFIKIEYIKNNKNKFNSYIFGSSRIGTTRTIDIEKYIPNSKFYNFTVSNGNMYDFLKHLNYIVENKHEIKNLYLQIDITNMASYMVKGGHRKLHPDVIGESVFDFYAFHITGFFPLGIKRKIKDNFFYKENKIYDIDTGAWSRPDRDKLIDEDCKKYVQQEKSFNQHHARVEGLGSRIDEITESLQKIKKISIENGINLYVFTTPNNQNLMDKFIVKDYLEFLKIISSITEFYNFTGYNSVTTNDCNYYEDSHYRPKIGSLIAARIFNDTSVEVPEDFGIFVNKDNIDKHLKKLELEIENHDLRKINNE